MRDIVAAGAHRRAAPEIEHDAARPFAVVPGVTRDDFLGGAPADLPGGARRHGARIDAEEIAPGRQHVEPPARRRAGRARRDKTAVERGEQPAHLRCRAGVEPRADRRLVGAALREQDIEIFGARLGARLTSEHMQAVADAHVFQIAKPGVETNQRRLGIEAGRGAFLAQSALPGALQDQFGDRARAARVERLRLRIFVEQALELGGGAMRARGDQRRRQMADRHRADAALGLRRFAGIVDDEGIDRRHWTEHSLRRA